MIYKISCESVSFQDHLRDGVFACVREREMGRGCSEVFKYLQYLSGKD